MSEIDLAEDADLEKALHEFAGFITNNPDAEIGKILKPTPAIGVLNPWGERNQCIILHLDNAALSEALNNVYLPSRYSAIYHIDRKAFEAVFTIFPLPESYEVFKTREFRFLHKGRVYNCRFGRSSERLLAIATYFIPVSASSTNWRNLLHFHIVLTTPQESREDLPMSVGDPMSFFIEGLQWTSEEDVLELINHLNFFMHYYDNMTTRVIVHPAATVENYTRPPRYVLDRFPESISSRPIDNTLLQFWEAGLQGDAIRRFLYNYMIIEYCSFYHIEDSVRRALRKVFADPAVLSDPADSTRQVIEIMSESKVSDYDKFSTLCAKCVKPINVWNIVKINRETFSHSMVFEGGVSIPALISKSDEFEHFSSHFATKFPSIMRKIRNSLSHGKEARMGEVITPTTANIDKLQVWIPVVSSAARDVMIYNHL